MYRTVGAQPFAAGHASAGVTAASTSWFLAEGATGPFFDLFILLANPGRPTRTSSIRYLLTDGAVLTKTYTVAAESRRTVWVDGEEFPGLGRALANVSVSSAITSTNAVPIVVERAMWFPGPEVTPEFWTEAHGSPGATAPAARWVLADGESGGTRDVQTFVLDCQHVAGRAAGPLDPAPRHTEPAAIRPIPDCGHHHAAQQPDHRAVARHPGVVEPPLRDAGGGLGPVSAKPPWSSARCTWNAGGVVWAAGTNLLATPLPP